MESSQLGKSEAAIAAEAALAAARQEEQKKRDELGEEKLTPVQAKMSSFRERSSYALLFGTGEGKRRIPGFLEEAELSVEDLPRIQLRITGAEVGEEGKGFLEGKVLGKVDPNNPEKVTPKHAIKIEFDWRGERPTLLAHDSELGKRRQSIRGVVGGIADGKPISQELAQKLFNKYYEITAVQEFVERRAKKDAVLLKEEDREPQLERDLL